MTLAGIDVTAFDYTLDLEGADGSIQLLWNPHLSSLRDAKSGAPVPLDAVGYKYEAGVYGLAAEVSPQAPGIKRDIRVLKISMGLKCNRSCAYCNQAAHSRSAGSRRDEVHRFLDNLHKVFSGGPGGDGADCRIEFWGGEPLLYWPQLRLLIGALHSLYPKARLNVISNGDLLSREIIAFLDDHDVGLGLSHDGPGMALRGGDPLDDPDRRAMWRYAWETLGAKRKLGFNAVLTRDNLSLAAIRNHIESRLDIPPDSIALTTEEILLPYDGDAMLCIPFTVPEQQAAREILFHEAVSGASVPGCATVTDKLDDLFGAIASSRPSYALMQKCGMDREDTLAIDLRGNITTCQNTSFDGEDGKHLIGTNFDLSSARLNTAHHMLTRDECKQCPVVQSCKGSCMFLEGDYWRAGCDVSFTFNVALFAAALFYITSGHVLTRISGRTIRRPEIGNNVAVLDVTSLMETFQEFGSENQRRRRGVA